MKVVAFLVWMLVLFAGEANACSCFGTPAPCQAYSEASAVFAGTVSYSSTVTLNEGNYSRSQRVVRFTIDEAFRGVSGTEAEVLTGLGDADCGYGFRLGGQYLVYAHRQKDDKLYTGICSRTRPMSDAVEDLAYMRGLGTSKSGATIFGEVRLNAGTRSKPLAGAKIIVEGPSKRVETTTDRNGKYKVSELLGDTYKVRIEPPPGLSVRKPEREAKLIDRGCAEISFWLNWK